MPARATRARRLTPRPVSSADCLARGSRFAVTGDGDRSRGREGITSVLLIAAGGLAYIAGALVYAAKRPDPLPRVFGYHELFHAFTIVALACQYVAIAFFVLRVA